MNKEVLRLLNNLKFFGNEDNKTISFEVLESEFEIFAENEDIQSISELNDVIEDDISNWEDDGQDE